jgi:hypothetical protein
MNPVDLFFGDVVAGAVGASVIMILAFSSAQQWQSNPMVMIR